MLASKIASRLIVSQILLLLIAIAGWFQLIISYLVHYRRARASTHYQKPRMSRQEHFHVLYGLFVHHWRIWVKMRRWCRALVQWTKQYSLYLAMRWCQLLPWFTKLWSCAKSNFHSSQFRVACYLLRASCTHSLTTVFDTSFLVGC